MLHASEIDTPIGSLLALARPDGTLVALPFLPPEADARAVAREHGAAEDVTFDDRAAAEVATQLSEYFDGRRASFDLRTDPGGTAFQRRVWRALEAIPFGATLGYGELARRIGSPEASRAVGRANGANPIPVVIPCHRVIGADGDLTGYGGGIERKRMLLRLEGALPDPLGL
jgi:methylated-DNA-[protein]-cysteine S-methyltransferase